MEGEKKAVKIAYLTYRDAKDKREWSGTLYNMAISLAKHAGDVIYLGPYSPKIILYILKAFRKFSEIVLRKRYNIYYSYLLTLFYKFHFQRKIKHQKPDVVFAASASPEMSGLNLDIPIIYLGDITFNLLIDNYHNFTNLNRFSLWEADKIEHKTFKKADALVFSSEWAANSAEQEYNVPRGKIHIISYGANMDIIPSFDEAIKKDISEKVRILFLGVDWIRKGGDITYRTFKKLVAEYPKVELTVCGCIPPKEVQHENLKIIPFLNKNDKTDLQKLYQILIDTHFLMVPSRSDCTPIVFCEANAFGIPVISTDVGGIPSVISNGVNGYILPLEADANEYSALLGNLVKNPQDYYSLSRLSRGYYDSNLNWDQWGKAMDKLIKELVTNKNKKQY